LRLLTLVLRWRRFLAWNIAIITVLGVVISLLLPQRFAATTRILPPPDDDPLGLSAQLSAGVAGQLGRLRSGMLGGGTPSDLMVGILVSNTVMESVVAGCSVATRFRVREASVQEAIRVLGKVTHIAVGDEGIVSVTVETSRPEWSAEIANCFASQLDVFLRNSNMNRGKNMRVFVEKRLADVASKRFRARGALTAYQAEHGLVALDEQLKGIVSSYAQLYAEALTRQTRLRFLESRSSPLSPFLINLRTDISTYRQQLSTLLSDRGERGSGELYGLAMESLPTVTAEYMRRYGEVALLEETYAMLYQQLEQARVMEARDTPTITVLDQAVPPDRRSYPRRALLVAVVFLAGLAMSAVFVVLADYFRRLRERRPEEYREWSRVAAQLTHALAAIGRMFSRKRRGNSVDS
jgi:uncharacterized protein involved in exopolysaccharide biosynthesis